jgi:hypothetical protein
VEASSSTRGCLVGFERACLSGVSRMKRKTPTGSVDHPLEPPTIRIKRVRQRPERIQQLIIPELIHLETLEHLRVAGKRRMEQSAFFGGMISSEGIGIVTSMYLPETEGDWGYVEIADPIVLERLAQTVRRRDEFLLAQIHSHPKLAFHSHTDDEGAICGDEGFISIVVPHYAKKDYGPEDWAVFELTRDGWHPWSTREERLERLMIRGHRVVITGSEGAL